MAPRRLTTIFAKRPTPGAVKTRLCPPLAPEEAARLAEAMLADTVAKCVACDAFETSLCVAPASELAWFRERFPGVREISAQRGVDLGARMAEFFARSHDERPGSTVVVIGSDAPHIPAAHVVAAHRALEEQADVVLGPDLGGGYYLIGSRQPIGALFNSVPMSTSDMCARTIELARAMKLSLALIDPSFDIDEADDALRLWEVLQRAASIPLHLAHTARELASLSTALSA